MGEEARQLGPYTIEREVGRGGMGVVYLARDTRLDRPVAIKVLPDDLADDPERLARFEREARLLASLNHPNIAGIYGLEEADGRRFLSLEYVDGPTLAERLHLNPLSLEETLDICGQIAAALEAAHDMGVIHRDLKPGNVKLTLDGKVKVLDFGLAKAGTASGDSSAELSHSPTITAHFTAPGVVLGTAAYMSPEQARGKPMDRRTDLFSFGCVLYECLTGRQLFSGETASDIIAQVLEREPDWSVLPPSTPRKIREVLRRSLQKDPAKRQRDIGDVRLAFDEVKEERSSAFVAAAGERGRGASRRALILAWGIAGLALVVAGTTVGVSGLFRKAVPQRQVRFEVSPPPNVTMLPWTYGVALSPDGRYLAWAGLDSTGTRIWIRPLNSLESHPLPQNTSLPIPIWSPDSRSIAYSDGAKLRRVAVDGGDPQTICDATSLRGGAWGKDTIVFALEQGPLYKVPASGGTAEPVTRLAPGQTAHRFPRFLPDGETFLYVALPGQSGRVTVFASDVNGREPVEIMTSVTSPVFAEPGYLLYQRENRLLARPFNPAKLEFTGDPLMIGPAPRRPEAAGAQAVSASVNGDLAFLNVPDIDTRLVWWDRKTGAEKILDLEPAHYEDPAISPDGRYVALNKVISPEESDIWVLELDRMVMTRFTSGPGQHADPVWSPDGRYIAYSTDKDGPYNIYKKPFPGGGDPEPVAVNEMLFKNPCAWSPDGKYLLYEQIGTGTNMDLWIAPTDGSGEPRPYLASVYQEVQGDFSPDGKWVVYLGSDTGELEMYVTSFPDPGRKYRLSTQQGFLPEWGVNGDEILAVVPGGREMISIPVRMGEPEFHAGKPVSLWRHLGIGIDLDVDPQGRGTIQVQPELQARSVTAAVVLNWAAGLTDNPLSR